MPGSLTFEVKKNIHSLLLVLGEIGHGYYPIVESERRIKHFTILLVFQLSQFDTEMHAFKDKLHEYDISFQPRFVVFEDDVCATFIKLGMTFCKYMYDV